MTDIQHALAEYNWIKDHKDSAEVNNRIARLLMDFVINYPALNSSIDAIFENKIDIDELENVDPSVVPIVIFRNIVHHDGIIYDKTTTTRYVGLTVNPFSLFSRKYMPNMFALGS